MDENLFLEYQDHDHQEQNDDDDDDDDDDFTDGYGDDDLNGLNEYEY